jgi:hypothetical protein
MSIFGWKINLFVGHGQPIDTMPEYVDRLSENKHMSSMCRSRPVEA